MFFFYVHMCICVWACAHNSESAENSEGLDPLELELWVAVSCLTRVLGTKFVFSARAVCLLNF